MVSDNVPTGRHRGAPKHGDALLAGLLRCRRCGRKLTVQYTGAKHKSPATPAARAGSTTVSHAASPSAACASTTPSRQRCSPSSARRDRRPPSAEAQAPVGATRSARRWRAISRRRATPPIGPSASMTPPIPQNRLVAGELEARWNRALTRVAEIERQDLPSMTPPPPASIRLTPVSFAALAKDLQAVWSAPTTDARLKKRIVRTVIHEVVADLDDAASEIVLLIHWVGGVHTEHCGCPRVGAGSATARPPTSSRPFAQLVL